MPGLLAAVEDLKLESHSSREIDLLTLRSRCDSSGLGRRFAV